MLKATKSSVQGNNQLPQPEEMVPRSQEELSSSEHKPDPEISFSSIKTPQQVPSMLMPYIRRSQNGLDSK